MASQGLGGYGTAVTDTPPLTRDINNLGEALARLDKNLTNLGAKLSPITRPSDAAPVPTGEYPGARPQLVARSRSSIGDNMEAMTATTERMIEFVQSLTAHLEV